MTQKVIYVSMKGTVTSPGTLLRPEGSFRSAVNAVIENPGVLRKAPGLNTTSDGTETTEVFYDTGYVHSVRAGTADTAVVSVSQDDDTTGMVKATGTGLYLKEKSETLGSSSFWGTSPAVLFDPAELQDDENVELYRRMDSDFPTGRQSTATFRNSIFFTTGKGVQRYDKETPGWIRRVGGLPNALPPAFMRWNGDGMELNGASGFLDYGYACAYRVLWFFEYEDGRRVYGPPSSRVVFWNTDGGYRPGVLPVIGAHTSGNVLMWIQIPYRPQSFFDPITGNNGAAGKYGCRLYRSKQAYLTEGVWPNDNMSLVNELYLDKTIPTPDAPSFITFTDSTPDDSVFLGEALYTNGDRDGILGANYPPENFHLLAEWRNRLWGANYDTKHRIELTMFALPIDNDSITIGEEEYFFKTTPGGISPEDVFIFDRSGIATNVYFTMQALCTAINEHSTTLNAYLISSPGAATLETGAGATIAVENRLFTTYSTVNDFTILFSSDTLAAKFRPYDSETSQNTLYSKNEVTKNTLWCTKYGEPTAWPADDNFSVVLGDSNLEILAMRAIEEGLYVFTTKGLYVMTGRSTPFSADLIDETFILVGDECVTFAEGALWAWSTQGLGKIKNGRVQYVSGPIQDQLNQYTEEIHHKNVDIGSWSVKKSSFAFMSSDTTHGRVFLWLPKLSNFE